jgi:hypothetical protein
MKLEPGSGMPQDVLRELENVLAAPGKFLTKQSGCALIGWE